MPKTKPYHSYLMESLRDPIEAAAYIDAVMEEGDPQYIMLALRNVVEAQRENIISPDLHVLRANLNNFPMEKITQFCDRWNVTEFALFGSVLRADFRPDSDIDIMVQFHPDAHPTFSTLDQMETELTIVFSRKIDLITRQGLETSRNYLRRHEILSTAQVIYATRSSIPA